MDSKVTRTTRICRHEDVILEELRDEAILLNLTTGVYTGLDAVGTRIWQLLEGLDSSEAIAGALVEEYDVPLDRAERDVVSFAERLLAAQLIHIEE